MRRNPTPFILLTLCCLLCAAGQAADLPGELVPLMNVPDKVAYESDFSRQETIEKRKKETGKLAREPVVRMLHTKKPDTIRKLLNARTSTNEAADQL